MQFYAVWLSRPVWCKHGPGTGEPVRIPIGHSVLTPLRFACDTVLPLFVRDVFHWNSTAAGLVFICFTSPLVGALADH